MKVEVLNRDVELCTRRRSGDVWARPRCSNPRLHPLERSREYVRALRATKVARLLAKPFLASMGGPHVRDAIFKLARIPTRIHTVFSGGCDGVLNCWDVSLRQCVWSTSAHTGFVRGIACDRQGRILITCGADKLVKLWDIANASSALTADDEIAPLTVFNGEQAFTGVDHHWTRDESFATSSTKVDVWDANRSHPIASFEWGAETIRSLAYNPVECNLLACTASDRTIVLHDTRARTPLRQIVLSMTSNDVAWNPREAFNFTVANEDSNLYSFDMRKLNAARVIHEDHASAVMAVDYAPSGKEFVSGGYDRAVRIFNVDAGHSREVYTATRMQRLYDVQFSGDARFVLSASDDCNIRLWKAHAEAPLKPLLPREKRAIQYGDRVRQRFEHVPELRRISRHRHLPKAMHIARQQKHEIKSSLRRKDENRRKHSKPGSIPIVAMRKKNIVAVNS